MRDVDKAQLAVDASYHKCIMMTYDDFKKLIETLTDGLKTIEYEFGIYVTHTAKAEETEEYDNQDLTEILSKYFDVKVTSVHSDTNEENPCMWIIYE